MTKRGAGFRRACTLAGDGRATALVFLLALLLAGSCEKVLFIELDESDKLIVLNGSLNTTSAVQVQVSRTRHILDNAPLVPLEDADVWIFRDGTLLEGMRYNGNGYYLSDGLVPGAGETYVIEVDHPGYPSVSATGTVPSPVPIEGLDTVMVTAEFEDWGWSYTETRLQMDLTLQDPAGKENYYLLSLLTGRSFAEYRDTTVVYVDSLFYNGEWNYFVSDSTYLQEIIHRFTDQPYLLSEDLAVEAITDQGILFSDQLIDGKTYSLRFQVDSYSLASADSTMVEVLLHSISEPYYKYLKSRQKHYETSDNYLAVPVIVFSNVEGGTGILGAYATDTTSFIVRIPVYRDPWLVD